MCQLCCNEGDLLVHRIAGGDYDNQNQIFRVKSVPEVYTLFDDLSYEISKLELKAYAQSAVGQRMQK